MRPNKQLHVDKSKKVLDDQAVASARAGVTGPGQTPAPGKLAKGGKHPTKFTPVKPAKPGVTSPR